jgi:hypothetical protein
VYLVEIAPCVGAPIPDLFVHDDSPPKLDYVDLDWVFGVRAGAVYSVLVNSNPELLNLTIRADGTLDLAVIPGRVGVSLVDIRATEPNGNYVDDRFLIVVGSAVRPGDANRDGEFDQRDIMQVLEAAKYLTAQPATWEQGDWNEDGVFDQLDIVEALQTGNYLQGPYAAFDAVFARA